MSNYNTVRTRQSFAPARAGARPEVMPGPRPAPVLGWQVEAARFARDPVGYMWRLRGEHGELSAWGGERPRRVFAFGREHVQQLLTRPELFHSQTSRDMRVKSTSAMANLRSGLLNLNGSQHAQHRRLMSPAFHRKQVENYRDVMVEATARMLDGWTAGEVRDVEGDMRRLVHSVAMKTVLGLEDPREVEELSGLITQMLSSVPLAMLFPFDLPGTPYRRMLRSAERISAFLQEMVERRRPRVEGYGDILAMLMRARDEHGAGLTDPELITEAYNVLCHETSASALAWTLLLLAQHPRVHAELLDELSGVLRGDPPALEQLPRLPLLEQVIKESMRLLPPAPFGRRYSVEDCRLGGYEVPANTMVVFSQYVTHRLESVYAEPQRFLPRRWETFKPAPYEYFPFGAGVHNCIGGSFAMLELKIVLAMLLQRFRVEVAPGARIDRSFQMSLRPKNGLPMTLARQDGRFASAPVAGDINEMVDFD